MSPQVGRRENTVAHAQKLYARCPGCFTRVTVGAISSESAIYMHQLSGNCAAHVPVKVRSPRKKKGEIGHDVRRPFFGGGFDG